MGNSHIINQINRERLRTMIRHGLAHKIEVFIITFVSYMSIHSLRTAYSFSKHYLPEAINVDKSYIGLIDTLMLLCLGIGHFYHTLSPIEKPVKTLWIGMILCAISYGIIPYAIDHYLNNLPTLMILMGINGFIQSYTWPNLLMIINQFWDKKRQSTQLGFWATNPNFGNIVGYFICQQITVFHLPWEDQMYIAAGFTLICGIVIAWRIEELKSADHHHLNTAEEKAREQEARKKAMEHMGIKAVLHEPSVLLLTAAFSFVKSVIYGLMLWLPMYFYDIGLGDYSTYIPITYDIFSIFGSVFLGYLFSKVSVKGKLLSPMMIILSICFFSLKFFHVSIAGYFGIIAVVGMCLGGCFNTIAGLVVIELTKVVPQEYQTTCLGFYSALTMSIANITTALTQLIIGFIVGKKDEQQIFILFMAYSFAAFICFYLQSRIQPNDLNECERQDGKKQKSA